MRLIKTASEIRDSVGRIAREVARDYEGRVPILVGVLTGAFVFVSDLARELTPNIGNTGSIGNAGPGAGAGAVPGAAEEPGMKGQPQLKGLEIEFLRASTYGVGSGVGDTDLPPFPSAPPATSVPPPPTDEVRITSDVASDIRGRDVIIVEDIIDRGLTASAVAGHLEIRRPASIRVCTLIKRKGVRTMPAIDYAGFEVGEGFIVGYGLDMGGRFRGLKDLYMVEGGQGQGIKKKEA